LKIFNYCAVSIDIRPKLLNFSFGSILPGKICGSSSYNKRNNSQ